MKFSRVEKLCVAGLCAALFAGYGFYRQAKEDELFEKETAQRMTESDVWMKRAQEDYIARKFEKDRLDEEALKEVERIQRQAEFDSIQRKIDAQRDKLMWDKKVLDATRKRVAAEEELKGALYGDK